MTPNRAGDPGLVYDSGAGDWVPLPLRGRRSSPPTASACVLFGSADPSDLNTPNIAIGSLAGTQTVTRTVTNVGRRSATYVAFVQEPAGVDVTVTPSRLRLQPGGKASFRVSFARTSAAFGEYALGSLTWSDGRHRVRSQIAVNPVPVAAPAEVSGTGTSGSTEIDVAPGFTGTLTTSAAGLIPSQVETTSLSTAGPEFDPAAPAASSRTAKYTVTIPAGTLLARHSTFDADVPAGTDVDLWLYAAGTADLVANSGGPTAEEEINIPDPPAGTYDLYVDLFAATSATVDVPAHIWTLANVAAGNLTVTPASQPVQVGQPVTVTAAWSGLTAGQRYLGEVRYGEDGTEVGGTVLRVDA